MGDEESIVVLKPQNFREWHNSIKGLANDQKVWDYVDPAKTKSVPERDEPPSFDLYPVVTADGTRPATRFSELTALQRESYREDMQNWRYNETYFDTISKGISTVRAAITKSASDCIPTDLKARSAREILKFLTNQYQLKESDEIEAVKARYRSLCTPPTKDKVQKWIVEWERLRYDIVSLKIGEISEQQMTLDFLRAGSKWVGIWAEIWPIGLRTAGRPIEFFDTAKEYRAKVLQEMSSTPGFAGDFQEQNATDASRSNSRPPRQPLCSLCSKHPDMKKCYWIKKNGRRRPWTENENVKAQLQDKIRGSYNLYEEIEKMQPDTGILDGITFEDTDAAATNDDDNSAAIINHDDDAPFRHYGNAAFSRLSEPNEPIRIPEVDAELDWPTACTRQRTGNNLSKLNDDSPDDFIPVLPMPFSTASPSPYRTPEPSPPLSPPPPVSHPPSMPPESPPPPPCARPGSRTRKKSALEQEYTENYALFAQHSIRELDNNNTRNNTFHYAFIAGTQNTLHHTQTVPPPPDHWGDSKHYPQAALHRRRSYRKNGPTPEGVETLNCTPGGHVQHILDESQIVFGELFEKALFIVF